MDEMGETKSMLLEQMRRLSRVDPTDEDAVRNQAVLAQSICNCAKVYNECYDSEAKLIREKREATKLLASAKTKRLEA